MAATCFVEIAGKKYGPIDTGHLRRLAATGKLSPDDLVSRDGETWVSAANVAGLFPQVEPHEQSAGQITRDATASAVKVLGRLSIAVLRLLARAIVAIGKLLNRPMSGPTPSASAQQSQVTSSTGGPRTSDTPNLIGVVVVLVAIFVVLILTSRNEGLFQRSAPRPIVPPPAPRQLTRDEQLIENAREFMRQYRAWEATPEGQAEIRRQDAEFRAENREWLEMVEEHQRRLREQK
jgi:hypothetical protein